MTKVRIECSLDELHAAIANSVRVALYARRTTIASVAAPSIHRRDLDGPCECMACTNHGELVRPLTRAELADALSEIGRNTAGGLLAYAIDEDDDHDCTGDEACPVCHGGVPIHELDAHDTPSSSTSFDRLCAEAVAAIEAPRHCDGCDDDLLGVKRYMVTHHDGTFNDDVHYCPDCAALARADWNGETKSIEEYVDPEICADCEQSTAADAPSPHVCGVQS